MTFIFNYISIEYTVPCLVVWNSLKWLRNITSAHISAKTASCSVGSHYHSRESDKLLLKIQSSEEAIQLFEKKRHCQNVTCTKRFKGDHSGWQRRSSTRMALALHGEVQVPSTYIWNASYFHGYIIPRHIIFKMKDSISIANKNLDKFAMKRRKCPQVIKEREKQSCSWKPHMRNSVF